jgi:hypothetical protein
MLLLPSKLKEVTVADSQDAQSKKERAAKRQQMAAVRSKRREARTQREASRKQKAAESGRPSMLCSLATVEVKRSNDGFQVAVKGQAGRKSFDIPASEANHIMRDLETAIQVIRGVQ